MFHWFKKHTKDGLELPDPTPIEIDMTQRPLTLAEQIARLTRNSELNASLQKYGIDTFDEAEDFDTGDLDHEDRKTPYEDGFYGSEMPSVKTKMDELHSGMVEEIPLERQEKARERLKKGPGLGKPSDPDPSPKGTGVPGTSAQGQP